MAASFALVLRACPEASRQAVGQFLGKAFSLKDGTCVAIAEAAPIVLLPDLALDEAAAMSLVLSGLKRLNAQIEFTDANMDDLPKIDWPKRPQIFKRELADHLSDLNTIVPCPDGSTRTVISLLIANLTGQALTVAVSAIRPSSPPRPVAEAPRSLPQPARADAPSAPPQGESRAGTQPFAGATLPEITPFSSPTVPATADDDVRSRLDQLFPVEDGSGGFVPDNADIAKILDGLLPEEEPSSAGRDALKAGTQNLNSSLHSTSKVVSIIAVTSGGYALFLAKISDEARRAKAVPVLAELGKLSTADAEALSKKVIIPVLKGVTKDEAEAARQRFAKIGILARVKAPE